MKVLAIHDAQGNIAALVVGPPSSPPAVVAAEPGQLVTEVEAPEVKVERTDPESYQRLVEVIENFRLELKAPGRLVRKTPGADTRKRQ